MYKKIKIVLAAILLASVTMFSNQAKAEVFGEGTNILHLGVGFGSPYYYSGSTSSIPPVHASFEHGITENIGIGGLVGYTSATWDAGSLGSLSNYSYKWKFTYVIVGLRGIYHFINTDKGDLYGGVMLGYNVASASFSSTDPNVNNSLYVAPSVGGLAFSGFVGGRYMFSEKIGGFAELGYNIAWISVGLTIKM